MVVKPVAIAVKACFKSLTVVFHVLVNATLDSVVRWALSGFRLWFLVLSSKPFQIQLDAILKESKGRLGATARLVARWGIEVLHDGLNLGAES